MERHRLRQRLAQLNVDKPPVTAVQVAIRAAVRRAMASRPKGIQAALTQPIQEPVDLETLNLDPKPRPRP
eukprot:365615-Chlamydomonas_euryale.AAC.7